MSDNSAGFTPQDDDVFGRIAGRYDRLCDLFSLGIHRLWKNRMADRAASESRASWLDLASGTGDIPLRYWRRHAAAGETVLRISDISGPMLAIAARRMEEEGAPFLIERQDARAIDAPDASLDLVTMAFGLKITDRARVLPEVYRVLKPGGVFLCLEASRIVVPGLHRLYLAYMDACMPLIGRWATGGDPSAYAYLLRGIHDFPDQRSLAGEMETCGFRGVTWTNLSLGVVALHRAVRPQTP